MRTPLLHYPFSAGCSTGGLGQNRGNMQRVLYCKFLRTPLSMARSLVGQSHKDFKGLVEAGPRLQVKLPSLSGHGCGSQGHLVVYRLRIHLSHLTSPLIDSFVHEVGARYQAILIEGLVAVHLLESHPRFLPSGALSPRISYRLQVQLEQDRSCVGFITNQFTLLYISYQHWKLGLRDPQTQTGPETIYAQAQVLPCTTRRRCEQVG